MHITCEFCLAYILPAVHQQHMGAVFRGNKLLQDKRLLASAPKPLRKVCDVQNFTTGFRIPGGLGSLPIQPKIQNPHPHFGFLREVWQAENQYNS